jgi:3-phosphoshikimate 1-carboxyvinyltransferase
VSDLVRVEHATHLRGSLRVPGDKSTSHRALLLSALASGESSITGLSEGEDVASTAVIIQQLGAVHSVDDGTTYVSGPIDGLRAAKAPLDCGNSGTTMRLLSGLVSGIEGRHELIGDSSLSKRPMDRVATPLRLMGAGITGAGETVLPPLSIEGFSRLTSIDYDVPVVSAQVKSAVLIAALVASGPTTVRERLRTRATTETMLVEAGIAVHSTEIGAGRSVTIQPGRPRRRDWHVPGDPSQAAFFAVLGAVHPDASLEVLSVDASPERVGFVRVLERMGASVALHDRGGYHALTSMSSTLTSTDVHSYEIPSVDEVPILTVAACAASGISAFRDMGELRIKESDRFAGSMHLAQELGCRVWSEGDDFFVEGLGSAGKFLDFTIDAGLDHRMVMASAVAGLAGLGCSIAGAATVASSYPHFFRDVALLGE